MPNLIFIPFLFILHLFHLFLVYFFFRFIPHARKKFEDKNLEEIGSISFKANKCVADFCFEVSSEGELEQVRPLILHYLDQGKKIELIFSSPSVEAKCLALQYKFQEQMRILRLPILTAQRLKNWVSADVILFCRYDFFPELLLLKLMRKKFVLLSGAVKKNSWYKKHVFSLFDIIVAATSIEEERFKNINHHAQTFTFDFRIESINQRWINAKETLSNRPALRKYLAQLNPIPVEQRIIIGSAWESDLHIFNNPDFISSIKESKIHVLIVPHQLGTEVIIKIQDYLIQLGLKDEVSVLLDDKAAAQNITPVVILNMSGVLCELYSLFSNSYIGGGYERSIHSVLEPFFSGSQVYIGPKVHRSTEYDFLAEIAPSEIHVLFHPEQFYTLYMNKRNITLNLETRNVWRESASSKIWEIANAIGSRL